MDAISFVLGEKTSHLRVKKLNDLIHGAPIGQPVSTRAHVTAVYEEADGSEIQFTRSIIGASSEWRLNGKVVTQQEYAQQLEDIGILMKSKNFLVFQGAVESIAMANAKERMHMFEEISKSGQLKADYERAEEESKKAETETQFSYNKKKGIAAEKKEAKVEKEEAEKYYRLKKDVADEQLQLQLVRLYYNEQDIEGIREQLQEQQKKLSKEDKRRESIEDEIKEKKKDQARLAKEMQNIDTKLKAVEAEISKKRPLCIKAKEKTAHMAKKLEAAKKSLKSARTAHDAHQEEIRQLEQELADVDAKRREYDEQAQGDSQSRGRDLHLESEQLTRYNRLKEEAAKKSAKYSQDLDSELREQKSIQDRLSNEERKKNDLAGRLRQKQNEKEDNGKRLDKLNEYISTSETSLAEYRRSEKELASEVDHARARIQEINKELEQIITQLGEAKVDRHESSRAAKKVELIDNLKRLFPGVFGRLLDLCEPSHKKYQIAITKVLGKNMEAIVCDSERTARECIQYMKEQQVEPETFLPLDYIQVKPANDRLRDIRDPSNVKLVIDVIRYEPPAIKKALQYACGNALVCDSVEDARRVAYGLNERHKAVALDGTLFQKSGIISGGASDLKAKARRWDEKQLAQLKSRKDKLTEEAKELMKKLRKESELNTIREQIKGLETRLRYSTTDRDNTRSKLLVKNDQDADNLKKQLEGFDPVMAELQQRINAREEKIDEIRGKMDHVEDEVFASFCKELGVPNIRVYEERELREQQERAKRKLEFDNQRSRLLNQLEYEKSRDTKANVTKWERNVADDEAELEHVKKEEVKQLQQIDEDMSTREKLNNTRLTTKSQNDDIENTINEIRKRLASHQKDMTVIQKAITAQETRLEQKRADRHSLLKSCKMDDIRVPMLAGTMDDIGQAVTTEGLVNGTVSSQTSTGGGGSSQDDTAVGPDSLSTQGAKAIYEREAGIIVDYAQLKSELKHLSGDEDVNEAIERLTKTVNEMLSSLQRIAAPNMKAVQKLDDVQARYNETSGEFEKARKTARKTKQTFDKVRKERFDRFMECFEHVSEKIDGIYKAVARNPSAQAILAPENPDEPYLAGVTYNCVAPGKRCRPMDNLSGGEKTVAALALLFAVHSYQPAPFFVLDEVDAALDNTNIGKVALYIKEQSEAYFQCIVISLKEEFYSKADALIGVYPEQGDCVISKVLTIDLTEYPEDVPSKKDKDASTKSPSKQTPAKHK